MNGRRCLPPSFLLLLLRPCPHRQASLAMAAAPAVVIVLQSALDSGAVDGGDLSRLVAADGLLQRTAKSTPADLMICRAGCTLPFLLWSGAGSGGAGGAANSDAARVSRLASTYRRGYVLVPFALLGDAAVLDAAARCRAVERQAPRLMSSPPAYSAQAALRSTHQPLAPTPVLPVASSAACSEVVTFVFMPQGMSFAAHALRMARELLAAEGDATAWRQQVGATRRGRAQWDRVLAYPHVSCQARPPAFSFRQRPLPNCSKSKRRPARRPSRRRCWGCRWRRAARARTRQTCSGCWGRCRTSGTAGADQWGWKPTGCRSVRQCPGFRSGSALQLLQLTDKRH